MPYSPGAYHASEWQRDRQNPPHLLSVLHFGAQELEVPASGAGTDLTCACYSGKASFSLSGGNMRKTLSVIEINE